MFWSSWITEVRWKQNKLPETLVKLTHKPSCVTVLRKTPTAAWNEVFVLFRRAVLHFFLLSVCCVRIFFFEWAISLSEHKHHRHSSCRDAVGNVIKMPAAVLWKLHLQKSDFDENSKLYCSNSHDTSTHITTLPAPPHIKHRQTLS